MAKIMVAMSGGVDSSLTAALLHEAGHDVIGVTMHLWDGSDERLAESLCCSQEMAESARRVCNQLGISYYVFNYQKDFRRHVIDYFLNEYIQGYTPNPCLACNREIKFRALLKRVQALHFDYLATGHYARIQQTRVETPAFGLDATGVAAETPRYELWRGSDPAKDQSYMLYMLQQDSLSQLLFPIGTYTKAQVRAMAIERQLPSADRPESQDICFVPGGDYRNLLQEEVPEQIKPGPIVDLHGREIGKHKGLPFYTVGQRKGLGLAGGKPLFVVAIDIERNALIVGPAEAILKQRFDVDQVDFIDGQWPTAPFSCYVQVRAHAEARAAYVIPFKERHLQVCFDAPHRAITPGQAAVLYDGERVLGGGRIVSPVTAPGESCYELSTKL